MQLESVKIAKRAHSASVRWLGMQPSSEHSVLGAALGACLQHGRFQ